MLATALSPIYLDYAILVFAYWSYSGRLVCSFYRPRRYLFQAGWKESHATFIRMLKNLEANGLSTAGPALKNTFDLLNINRMQSGIDTYGQVCYDIF